MAAFEAGTLVYEVLDTPDNEFTENLPSSLHFRGDPVPDEPQRGPQSFYPDGRRYSINGRRVEWLGWEFEFGVRTVSGLQVFDISYQGERIAYEIR